MNVCKYLRCEEDRLFSVVLGDKTGDSGYKQKHGRFCPNIRKHLFSSN